MQQSKLHESEIQLLNKFRLTMDGDNEKSFIKFTSLLNSKLMRGNLEDIGDRIGAPNHRITASLVMKRMAFYAVIHFYTMTLMGKKIKVDHDDIKLIENMQSDLWLPDFYLGPIIVEPQPEDRETWRDEIITDVFLNTINQLILLFSKKLRISRLLLWENIALYLFWLYEDVIGLDNQIAKEDFHYIVHEAPGKLFGSYEKNPLSTFDSNPICRENRSIRVRKTCCLSYLLEGSNKKMCITCPLYDNKMKLYNNKAK